MKLKQFLPHFNSIRVQLLILFGLSMLTTAGLLTTFFVQRMRKNLILTFQEKANILIQNFAGNSRRGLQSQNLFGELQELLASLTEHREVVMAFVADNSGHILTSTEKERENEKIGDPWIEAVIGPDTTHTASPAPRTRWVRAGDDLFCDIAIGVPVSTSEMKLAADLSRKVKESLLSRPPSSPWLGLVYLKLSTGQIRKEFRKQNMAGFLYGSVFCLMGLALAWLLSKRVTAPLKILMEATQQLSTGKFVLNTPAIATIEFTELMRAFQSMAQKFWTAQKQLVQSEKLAAIGELAAGVAHEINNPLTTILGNSQLLLHNLPKDSPDRESLKEIEQASLRCKTIVSNLLGLSRHEEFSLQSGNLIQILDKSVEIMSNQAKITQVDIVKRYEPAIPELLISPIHLQQVFLNVMMNAIQAMPKGGTLTIATQTTPKKVSIRFEDTGAGMTPEVLPRVFEAFFTTKLAGKGTGLGLSLSHTIIQLHNGTITAESPGPGKGSVFTVALPLPFRGPEK